jgi:hypothetical protein
MTPSRLHRFALQLVQVAFREGLPAASGFALGRIDDMAAVRAGRDARDYLTATRMLRVWMNRILAGRQSRPIIRHLATARSRGTGSPGSPGC